MQTAAYFSNVACKYLLKLNQRKYSTKQTYRRFGGNTIRCLSGSNLMLSGGGRRLGFRVTVAILSFFFIFAGGKNKSTGSVLAPV